LLALVGSGCAPEGPTAFVTFAIAPDAHCLYASSAETFYPKGSYDISPDGGNGSKACDEPYQVVLKTNSFLRSNSDPDLGRAEPNILRVHSAEVKLMNLQKQPLLFADDEGTLPNPFLVTTGGILEPATSNESASGVSAVEVIPVAYTPFLYDFVNDQILAEIQLFGTTTGDVDVDFQPFVYPIEICDGCMTLCQTTLDASMMLREDVVGEDNCDDNSGADGRVCIDPGC
jgi:hypothetical protein